MKNKDITLVKNTTKAYELRFKKNGQAYDITGWTVYFTVKEKMKDTDVNAKIKKDITNHLDAINGKTLIEISVDDTNLTPKNYYYSIDFKDEEGNIDVLYTGRFRIMQPVRETK